MKNPINVCADTPGSSFFFTIDSGRSLLWLVVVPYKPTFDTFMIYINQGEPLTNKPYT